MEYHYFDIYNECIFISNILLIFIYHLTVNFFYLTKLIYLNTLIFFIFNDVNKVILFSEGCNIFDVEQVKNFNSSVMESLIMDYLFKKN